MSEPHDDLAGAFHRLRGEVRDLVPVPAAAEVRARASHQLRVRRVASVAAAVVAVAIGGTAVLRPDAGPPAPPADTPTPSEAPVTPSPRPEPRAVEALDDPIVEVDWRAATIDIPPHAGCPSGAITFAQDPEGHSADWAAYGPGESYPRLVIDAALRPAGDLTGDGRAEAVLTGTCLADEEDSGDGQGQLLVVTRTEGGELRALAWVGPRGAVYHAYWIADGYLYADASPHTGDEFDWAPGGALRYRWDGGGFAGGEPAPEYPPIVPPDQGGTGAPARLRAVADGLGCPDVELRFTRSGADLIAAAGGATYAIPSGLGQQYLFDLDNTGDRLLVTALRCTRPDGTTGYGLAVLEPAGAGWQGISVVVAQPAGRPTSWEVSWQEFDDGRLWVIWTAEDWSGDTAGPYRWNGTVLEPVDE